MSQWIGVVECDGLGRVTWNGTRTTVECWHALHPVVFERCLTGKNSIAKFIQVEGLMQMTLQNIGAKLKKKGVLDGYLLVNNIHVVCS